MRAGEFHADLGLCGEHLDCFFALAQELEELQAFRAGKGLADAGNLLVEVVLDISHTHNLTIIRLLCKPGTRGITD